MLTEAVINAKEKRQQKQLRKREAKICTPFLRYPKTLNVKKRLCYSERYLRLFGLAENTKAAKARKIYAEKI